MRTSLLLASLAATFAGCAPLPEPPSPTPDPTPSPTPEPTPDSAVESLEPPETAAGASGPHLAVDEDGVVLSWVEPTETGHALRFSRLTDTWSVPVTIAAGDDWFVNWADVPSIASAGADVLYAHWLKRAGEGTYAYHVHWSASTDGGATWLPGRRLHDDASPSEHGFASFAPLPSGDALAVWLDGAATEDGGAMQLRSRTVSAEGDVGPEVLVDDGVCDCCPTTLAAVPGGAIAGWRDRTPDEVRDMAVARWDGAQWEAPRVPAADRWTINGCPVNGPAIDARGSFAAMAWFTAEGEAPRVQVIVSSDSGATFGAPRLLSESTQGRVELVALDDEAVAFYLEESASRSFLVARFIAEDGTPSEPVEVEEVSRLRRSGIPRAVRAPDGSVLVAWTALGEEETHLRLARLSPR